jgi:hypothetical protein
VRIGAAKRTDRLIVGTVVASIALCFLAAQPAIAAKPGARNPVALVVEKKGRTSPDLQPYSEIMAGETFKVLAGSSLVFIDYRSCNRVTVSGTTVTFSSSGFSTSRNDDRTEQRVACPQTLAPDNGGDNSSLLMRGIDLEQKFPLVAIRSTFLIVDAQGRKFARVKVKDASGTLVDAKLRGARFDWPASTPSLEAGKVYRMVLLPQEADDRPLKLTFRAVADSPSAPQAIVLIDAGR